jgi:hypothetical protein
MKDPPGCLAPEPLSKNERNRDERLEEHDSEQMNEASSKGGGFGISSRIGR